MTHDNEAHRPAHVPAGDDELDEFYNPRPPSDDDVAQVKTLVRELHELLDECRADSADRNRRIRDAAEERKRPRRRAR